MQTVLLKRVFGQLQVDFVEVDLIKSFIWALFLFNEEFTLDDDRVAFWEIKAVLNLIHVEVFLPVELGVREVYL